MKCLNTQEDSSRRLRKEGTTRDEVKIYVENDILCFLQLPHHWLRWTMISNHPLSGGSLGYHGDPSVKGPQTPCDKNFPFHRVLNRVERHRERTEEAQQCKSCFMMQHSVFMAVDLVLLSLMSKCSCLENIVIQEHKNLLLIFGTQYAGCEMGPPTPRCDYRVRHVCSSWVILVCCCRPPLKYRSSQLLVLTEEEEVWSTALPRFRAGWGRNVPSAP